jgi:hypothetical protein
MAHLPLVSFNTLLPLTDIDLLTHSL